jgi:outer membrane protein OmpA-like peptidoglycan-associated protein
VGNDMGLKIHFNEGVISSFQPDKGVLLVTGVGIQYIVFPPLVLGVEANDRTFLSDPKPSDPFWITPSVVFRTPDHMNVEAGADISVTKNQPDGTQTLTPWRAFVAVSLSYDTQAEMKRRQEEAARQRMLQDQALAAQARQAEMAKDSIARAASDSIARAKAMEDSMAVKAHQDSITLAATQGALNEEISKRSDEEKQLLTTGLLVLDAVYFETGKTDISINSDPYLKLIAKMLTKYPKLQIEIAGNTDNVGGSDYNMGLSQGRAEAVMNYMVQVAPDLNGRLTAKGYGYTRPKASNSTAAGRKLNRRTELRVTNKEALKEYNP